MVVRPILPPGGDVVRRDAHTLVVGTRPGVPVRDHPGLLGVLRLADGRSLEGLRDLVRRRVPELNCDLDQLVDELLARGALVDATVEPPPSLSVRLVAGPAAGTATAFLQHAIDSLGVADHADDALLIPVSLGEPSRRWIADASLPHVGVFPVTLFASASRLGPFTVPGLTPCLGCYDHQRAQWDPAWSVVVPQLGRPLVNAAPDEPEPGALWRTAAVLVEHVAAIARAGHSTTVGTVTHVDQHGARPELVSLHPRCRCGAASQHVGATPILRG